MPRAPQMMSTTTVNVNTGHGDDCVAAPGKPVVIYQGEKARKVSNYVRTTKYTLLTFLPLNLFEQFRKASNIYFLINMIITLIPGVSPIFPITSILPVIFILAVAGTKDAFEDHRRYRADKKANGALCTVVRKGKLLTVRSDEVEVGDFIKLERGAEFCADILLLSSALGDGMAYVETANLDGETNLKPRHAIRETQHLTTPAQLDSSSFVVTCDAPNPTLVKWQGVLDYQGLDYALDVSNIVFRGCKLMNTPWAYGIVLYCGKDTKMMQNLKQKAAKFSGLDKKLNKLILGLVAVQLLILTVLSSFSVAFAVTKGDHYFHLVKFYDDENLVLMFVLNFLTFFVLLNYMMPISLFVSMELCKGFQAVFMEWDIGMMHEGKTMSAKTSNLNEELSQVRWIFSDKTGTLTENEMRFSQCCIGKLVHPEEENPGGLKQYLSKGCEDRQRVIEFMTVLTLCHTVVCSPDERTGQMVYEGQSTDEVALVQGASNNGFAMTHRDTSSTTVEILGVPTYWEILQVLEFTSDRKRMTVVARSSSGELYAFMKGADSHVLPLVTDGENNSFCIEQLAAMSKEGLRTLAIASKRISLADYEKWKVTYEAAALSLNDREAEVAEAAKQMEFDMKLLGCTGVEDRLQDRVPETIHYFLQAGILFWMLTGDKQETAVNIAHSTNLVDDSFVKYPLGATSFDEMTASLQDVIDRQTGANTKAALVIEGESLQYALAPGNAMLFQQVGCLMNSAICCRVTPLQKAMVVNLFKKLGHTAIAIGDGANDVSMIQEAKVGVGIMGLEGSQATLASDYAIPKFKHLVRLVACHGRHCMVRNAILVQYSFYKNLVLTWTIILYTYNNGFSGQTLFNSWVLQCFNVVFTSLPPLIMGIFERDLCDDVIEQDPLLLVDVSRGQDFSIRTASLWLLASIYHGFLIYWLMVATFPQDDSLNGRTSDLWTQGSFMVSCVITCVLAKNALVTRTWTWIQLTALLLSYLSYFLFLISWTLIDPEITADWDFYWVAIVMLSDVKFWLWTLMFGVGVLAPDFALMYLKRELKPAYRDITQVRYKEAKVDHALGSNSRI